MRYTKLAIGLLATSMLLAACGETMERRAATGGLGGAAVGALVGGPVGAVAGGAAGATGGAVLEEGVDTKTGRAVDQARDQLDEMDEDDATLTQ